MAEKTSNPYDPYCQRYAADMAELDLEWSESDEQLAEYDEEERMEERRRHARADGTYNVSTQHFACTDCYIAIGMPSSPEGWKAP